MTINTTDFYNWQKSDLDHLAAPFESASPNLVRLLDVLTAVHGGVSLGIHGNRSIRDGGSLSSHAFGAALDWRWGVHSNWPKARWLTRDQLDAVVIPALIENSDELGIQAIHDQGRIARSSRDMEWRDYPTRYGPWLHIETTRTDFGQTTRIRPESFQPGKTAPPAHPFPFDPSSGMFGLYPLSGSFGTDQLPLATRQTTNHPDHVKYLQGVILHRAGGNIAVDGKFGPKTNGRVEDLQRFFGLTVDGKVGQVQTWPLVHALAIGF